MAQKISVLVADDDDIIKVILEQLSSPNYMITFAADGQEVTETNLKKIDIILLDINMPIMSGIEAAKTIRQLEKNDAKKIPIIGITANIQPDILQECIDAGMDEVLNKPIFPKDIDAVIARWDQLISSRKNEKISHTSL